MKIHAILNRDGGTLKTTDLDALGSLIGDEFGLHGHEAKVEVVAGSEVGEAIRATAARTEVDVLLIGGGDGTVSSAAAAVMGTDMALAILPAGTMNLFARTLQIPANLDAAVKALANGRVTAVDIASVNGEPFVHQFAVGLYARMVRARERIDYASRLGKMWATTKAITMSLNRPPSIDLELEIDGKTQLIRTPVVAISNNLYGEGHLPYADDPKGGVLGVYICTATDSLTVARLAVDMLRGVWTNTDALTVRSATKVKIRHQGSKRSNRSVRDGELTTLEPMSEVMLHPRGLKVLAPEDASYL